MSIYTLLPGQQILQDLAGRFVFLEQADGPVYFSAVFPTGSELGESGILLDPRDQARWDERFTALRITNNHHTAQTIRIKCSDAQYFPKQDGGAVHITGQNAPLDVQFSDPVLIDDSNPVRVSLADSEVALRVLVDAGSGINPLAEIVPDVSGATIPANPDRKHLVLKVDAANSGSIWLSGAASSGIPLDAGDPPFVLDTMAAVALTATNGVDKIYVMEVLE